MWRRLRLLCPAALCVLAGTLSDPAWLSGAELSPVASSEGKTHAPFELRVHESRLSLQAEAASVVAILEAMGRQMEIDVVVRLREDRQVTVAFANLPLQDALKRLGVSAATVVEADRQGMAKVTKIVVLEKGVAAALSPSTPQPSPVGQVKPRSARSLPPAQEAAPIQLNVAPSAITDVAPFKMQVEPATLPKP